MGRRSSNQSVIMCVGRNVLLEYMKAVIPLVNECYEAHKRINGLIFKHFFNAI